MTFPLLVVTPALCCCSTRECIESQEGWKKGYRCGFIVTLVTPCAALCDLAATITLLIVGILGAFNIIGISPAASRACIGIACAIPPLWLISCVACCLKASPLLPEKKY